MPLTGRWNADVFANLTALLAGDHGDKPLATFDWDNTCITGDIGEAVLEDLGPAFVAEYDRRCAIDKLDGYTWCALQVAGRTDAEAVALAERALSARLADGRMRVRPEIVGLMRALEAAGFEVWIVSASEERLVRAFAPRYGIPRERVIGMRLAEEGGILVPRVDGAVTYRQGKVDAIDARIGRRPVFAAGDAETDLEMLESAGHRLFLDKSRDPADRMRAFAAEKGWWQQPAQDW